MMLTVVYQEVNIQNMNVELVAQMFKNYQSNVLFHLEGMSCPTSGKATVLLI
jgi:DASH complex subunit DAD4